MGSVMKKNLMALAGVAQWIERRPANQRVAGLIPSQGTCLGCGTGPQQGVGWAEEGKGGKIGTTVIE